MTTRASVRQRRGDAWAKKFDRPGSASASWWTGGATGTPQARLRRPAGRGLQDPQVHQEGSTSGAGIPKIEIERTREKVIVFIHSARVGVIIGKKGPRSREADQGAREPDPPADRGQDVEVDRPEIDAAADRRGHRRAAREAVQLPPDDEAGDRADDGGRGQGRQAPAVRPARRLGNGPQREGRWQGSIPLSTLRAKVEYGFSEAKTAQGHIGIKVWVNQGDYLKTTRGRQRPMAATMPKRVQVTRKSQRAMPSGEVPQDNGA